MKIEYRCEFTGMQFFYEIGESYRYFSGRTNFKLIEVSKGIFIFECGHRVTDCVFQDLVNVKTDLSVFGDRNPQYKLQLT